MKILLVQPPYHDTAFALGYATEPLGLETIAGAVPDHDVTLLDLRFAPASLADEVARLRPDVVATGGNTCSVYDLVGIVQTVKRVDPRARTVVGGHHGAIAAEDFALPEVDAIVIGPGEETFPALLEAWQRGCDLADTPGLGIVRDGKLTRTAARALPRNLDGSPLPNRALTASYRRHYRAFGRRVGLVNTSRGCPYRCTFCSIANEMGRRYLVKSPERVLEDLATVPQRNVRFADGNTFGSPERAARLAAVLRAAKLGKRFMVDARADTAVRHPGLFEAWRDAGLRLVAVGFEAATARALESFGKDSSLQDNVEAMAVFRGAGLEVIGQFIVDPDFDDRDFDELASFVLCHGVHYPSFTIATPFPGTRLREDRDARIVTRDLRHYDCMHSVMVPRLGWDRFYRRFIDLYETCYGPGRVVESARQWIDRREGFRPASPFLLGAVALQVRLSRRRLEKAWGVR